MKGLTLTGLQLCQIITTKPDRVKDLSELGKRNKMKFKKK
jgi:hypothetical protein